MSGEVLKLDRVRALAVVSFLGWKTASGWSNEKIAANLAKSRDVYEPGTNPEDDQTAKDLVEVLAALESGTEIQVTGDDEGGGEGAQKEKPKKGRRGKKGKKEEAEAADDGDADDGDADDGDADDGDADDGDADDGDADDGSQEEKPSKPSKPSKPKRGRIRSAKSRGYCAGKVLAEHFDSPGDINRKNGITAELIDAVDKEYGKANPKVSKGALTWAVDALMGFAGTSVESEGGKKE